jgi:hypothetical protein
MLCFVAPAATRVWNFGAMFKFVSDLIKKNRPPIKEADLLNFVREIARY